MERTHARSTQHPHPPAATAHSSSRRSTRRSAFRSVPKLDDSIARAQPADANAERPRSRNSGFSIPRSIANHAHRRARRPIACHILRPLIRANRDDSDDGD